MFLINVFWIIITMAIGGGSLALILLFFYFGAGVSLGIVDFNLEVAPALVLDTALCLLFFIQHSLFIRPFFRKWMERHIKTIYHGAFYSVTTGIALFIMIFLWQHTPVMLIESHGAVRLFMRALFFIALVLCMWGIRSVGNFDGFGIRPFIRAIKGKSSTAAKSQLLSIKGPYQFVRHPLYLSFILIVWSNPDISADMLLCSALWTAWIIIGTILEERDLIANFGDDYKRYSAKVPMLIPIRISAFIERNNNS
jgi:protein-S-isoprenylcysteine O-methyltransferase Ste14